MPIGPISLISIISRVKTTSEGYPSNSQENIPLRKVFFSRRGMASNEAHSETHSETHSEIHSEAHSEARSETRSETRSNARRLQTAAFEAQSQTERALRHNARKAYRSKQEEWKVSSVITLRNLVAPPLSLRLADNYIIDILS